MPVLTSIFDFDEINKLSFSLKIPDMDPTQDDEAPKDPGAQKIIQGFDEKDFEGKDRKSEEALQDKVTTC